MAFASELAFVLDHIRENVGTGPSAWFPALAILFFLGLGAASDARTGRVPDRLMLCGGVIALASRWVNDGLPLVIWLACAAFALFAGLWLLNALYYLWRKQDGLGMGDAKWLAVALVAFGPQPALISLFGGAWIALIAMALTRGQSRVVHFAPYLFFGLLIGIAFF